MGERETGETTRGRPKTERHRIYDGALVTLDEGAALAALGNRQGSTTLATLRSMWTGGQVGQANASAATTRRLDPNTYSLGFVMGLQPEKAEELLSDTAAGTPQRFIWARTVDPSLDAAPVDWPGPLKWQTPQQPIDKPTSCLDIHPAVIEEVRCEHLARVRGERIPDALDAHRDLLRLKVAGVLAVLDRRLDITEEDWNFAGTIVETSTAVRTAVTDLLAEQRRQRAAEADRQTRQRAKAIAETTEEHADTVAAKTRERCAGVVTRRASTRGRLSKSDANQALSGRDKKHVDLDEVLDLAVERGWLASDGDGYVAGPNAGEVDR